MATKNGTGEQADKAMIQLTTAGSYAVANAATTGPAASTNEIQLVASADSLARYDYQTGAGAVEIQMESAVREVQPVTGK